MNEVQVAEVQVVSVKGKLKKRPDRLPWPRKAADDPTVELGVDVVAKKKDIIKLVHKFFRVQDVPMDELLQEVYCAILHKNYTRSAHDPRKSSFGHYVYMVANNVCINLVHKKKRYDREGTSIDEPSGDDDRPMIDTVEADESTSEAYVSDSVDELEITLRRQGRFDLARFVRAAKTGASAEVIREALSWDGNVMSNKEMRDIRHQIRTIASGAQVSTWRGSQGTRLQAAAA